MKQTIFNMYTMSGKKSLHIFLNNFNRCKLIFIIFAHIITMIHFTESI